MAKTYYEKPKRTDKLSKDQKMDLMFDLISSFSQVKGPTDSADFLEDLLTANEIRNLSVRLRIAKLLLANVSQREISREIHTSLATINKVNIWLSERGGGFRKVISKLPLKWEKPTKFPRGPIEYHLPELILASTQFYMANKKEKRVNEFIKGVEDKKNTDKQINQLNKEIFATAKSKRINNF